MKLWESGDQEMLGLDSWAARFLCSTYEVWWDVGMQETWTGRQGRQWKLGSVEELVSLRFGAAASGEGLDLEGGLAGWRAG